MRTWTFMHFQDFRRNRRARAYTHIRTHLHTQVCMRACTQIQAHIRYIHDPQSRCEHIAAHTYTHTQTYTQKLFKNVYVIHKVMCTCCRYLAALPAEAFSVQHARKMKDYTLSLAGMVLRGARIRVCCSEDKLSTDLRVSRNMM